MSLVEGNAEEDLSKIKDMLERENVQEVSQMSVLLEQLKQQRVEAILDMGNEIHRRIQIGLPVDDPELRTYAARVEELDKSVCELSKTINKLER